MLLLIDNGHGDPPLTGGKCSPDRRILEYTWAREIAQRLSRALTLSEVETMLLVPEKHDVPLKERTRRANAWCAKRGAQNCLLVSIHINAAPGTGWSNASGFSEFVAPNASQNSKRLAKLLYQEAEKAGLQGNRSVPACRYWEGNFAIIRDTKCPAVLTENLFMTNRTEVDYLLSEQGKQTIVDIHVKAITRYINGEAA
ncbi:MAG: N-acetylmuramoyl-L-alanine amidase [Bacteroidaceae bacterium]|nr:N-acetylmuramoyl-L-alanine amidase [Bacteroidaceae bacterium]